MDQHIPANQEGFLQRGRYPAASWRPRCERNEKKTASLGKMLGCCVGVCRFGGRSGSDRSSSNGSNDSRWVEFWRWKLGVSVTSNGKKKTGEGRALDGDGGLAFRAANVAARSVYFSLHWQSRAVFERFPASCRIVSFDVVARASDPGQSNFPTASSFLSLSL